jgi:hypothetical protein
MNVGITRSRRLRKYVAMNVGSEVPRFRSS